MSVMTWAGLLRGVESIMWAVLVVGVRLVGVVPRLGRSRAPRVPRSRTWL